MAKNHDLLKLNKTLFVFYERKALSLRPLIRVISIIQINIKNKN